eukprot:SAG31_NODE_707_length_12684_cov_16.884863_10_plen_116_part_00
MWQGSIQMVILVANLQFRQPWDQQIGWLEIRAEGKQVTTGHSSHSGRPPNHGVHGATSIEMTTGEDLTARVVATRQYFHRHGSPTRALSCGWFSRSVVLGTLPDQKTTTTSLIRS